MQCMNTKCLRPATESLDMVLRVSTVERPPGTAHLCAPCRDAVILGMLHEPPTGRVNDPTHE